MFKSLQCSSRQLRGEKKALEQYLSLSEGMSQLGNPPSTAPTSSPSLQNYEDVLGEGSTYRTIAFTKDIIECFWSQI